ncbi:hypothetical protein FA15DRAFT_579639 [Coprinopsis marcescibilis]|uniref:Micro-fibrillar-associated protein 1 C-terminal domain-containing protein n=1 Tax=Coprinopsis marcescibilis TaxID=230819 RepID=A0A5C3LC78_COPMA|nr:hypothetical protein FA15DRAFT_579639 [Coprinopsis marcescibilis]
MSLATTVPRKTAPRLAKPATRYWKGKAPKGAAEIQDDSDEDEEEQNEEEDIPIGDESDDDEQELVRQDVRRGKTSMNIALRDVAVSKEGKVIIAGREESGRTAAEEEEQESEEDESAGEDESQEGSSSEESESEEEQPKVQFRPVFVPKRARVTVAEKDILGQDSEEAQRKREEEAEERRKQSHAMVADSIRRELAESEADARPEEKEDEVPDVDDTDGLDPEGEFEAWRLRELARIKKEKEDELAREQEREEIERRRAMPEEQRMKEDLDHAKKSRDAKPQGQQKFLQKYWHKGAFHQDLEILKRHDFTEATESTLDVSLLPKVMQVKDFGKRSRTKYTHLLDQDTTASTGGFGGTAPVKAGGLGTSGGGCFNCGGPHLKKDCPQVKEMGTGSNSKPVGGRQEPWPNRRETAPYRRDERVSKEPGSRFDKASDNHRQPYRHERDHGFPRKERSRSRSPYRSSGYREKRQHSSGRYRSRSRDRSIDRERERERDKRRLRVRRWTRYNYHPTALLLSTTFPCLSSPLLFSTSTMTHPVKVAVVGSGLAGLTASYLLTKPVRTTNDSSPRKLEVHLFEKAQEIGMDSASTSIPTEAADRFEPAKEWRIDVPMRSFLGGYYRNVIALYRSLGVAFRASNFTYSFSFLDSASTTITTTALYNGGNGLQGVSKPTILIGPQKTKDEHLLDYWTRQLFATALFVLITAQLAVCYAITLWQCLPYWRSSRISKLTLGEWANDVAPKGRVAQLTGMDIAWDDYVQTMLIPLMSAMCTAPEEDILNHPVEEILDYCWLGLGQNHFVLDGGVKEVVSQLSSGIEHQHLGSTIISIRPDPSNNRLISIECVDSNGTSRTFDGFDHIVFATQALRAVPLLKSYATSLPAESHVQREAVEAQIRCLQTFKYCSTIVVNHTDDALLPVDPRDRRDLNLISSDREEENQDSALCVPHTYTMATHTLARPEGHSARFPVVYQTTNPFIPPHKDTVLDVSTFERAVLTVESKQALSGLCKQEHGAWWECPTETRCHLGELQGAGRLDNNKVPGIWICGSYAYSGIPLLEGCVVSARNVVEEGILKTEGLKFQEAPWNI